MQQAVQAETSVATPIEDVGEPTTEWEDAGHVLHRVTGDEYVLYSPSAGGDVSPAWLAGHGVDSSWWCEFSTVGDVLVTVFRRAGSGIAKNLVDFVEPRWT